MAPELPPALHNEFAGYAQVEYTVMPNGELQDLQIVSAEWRPIGNTRGEPRGYDEAILRAVGQWKYESRGRPCMATTRITFEFEE